MNIFNSKTGFLNLHSPPLTRLPLQYEPWELLLDDLVNLILSQTLRSRVLQLPLLSTKELFSFQERQRAHLVLSLLAHGYIVGFPKVDVIDCILPESLALPWFQVSCSLGLKPVVCYSTLELANFKLLNPKEPISLNNLAMLHTFSGSFDESWFYLVPLAIEAAGAPALQSILEIQNILSAKSGSDKPNEDSLLTLLVRIKESIQDMTSILKQMYTKNDPHIFWNRVRPYSSGSKNASQQPDGLFYEGVLEMDEYVNKDKEAPLRKQGTWRRYAGASAGQSPLIHALDVGLSIHHTPLQKTLSNPMLEMRDYLCRDHREFLIELQDRVDIREYILESHEPLWVNAFNEAIDAFKSFRDTHIQLTSVYIIQQSIKERNLSEGKDMVVGTGGTDLVKFLKQTRDETVSTRI